MDRIKCPHCGKQVELSEAIVHELAAKLREEEAGKLKAQFEEEKAKERAKQEKELREEFEKESKEKTLALEEMKRKERLLAEKLVNELEEREKREAKIREEESEKSRLEKLSYEKKLSDMQKSLEEAQRKGKQGSQQLQGEVLELDLEEKLKKMFPYDELLPVPKGFEGGDIWQKVNNKFGKNAGSIIWETKRTKAWSKSWLIKLKEDMIKIGASEAILVSQILPLNVSSFERIEGVWVTSYENALSIAGIVRFLILKVAIAKSNASHDSEELKQLYDYLTSSNFQNKMQKHFDIIKIMREDHQSDVRITTQKWKKREQNINKIDMNLTEIYAELQGVAPNLPSIKASDSGLLDSVDDDEQTNF